MVKDVDSVALANSPKFKKFYGLLCKMTGLTLVIADPSSARRIHLDGQFRLAPLCSHLRRDPRFHESCSVCDREFCDKAVRERKGFYYRCHAGLYDLVVPIFIDRKHIGTFIGGQIRLEPPTDASFRAFFENLAPYSFNENTVRKLYFETAWMTSERLDAALELIVMFAEHFYELGSRLLEKDEEETTLEQVKRYIFDHLTEPLSLEDVAGQAGLTPTYFSRWFKNKCSMGFVDFLHRRRIEKACKLLETTDYPIIRIAFDSGFTSLTTFNRVFSRVMKESPSRYRKP
jgi:AraC-like DNA-binding protein/ligand-binding sensor protein